MNGPKALRVLVFDAYGTLFDVQSVQLACERAFPGNGNALTELWRQKQLEYTWQVSLMGAYQDFWALTRAGLIQACGLLRLPLTGPVETELMEQYWRLQAFPDAQQTLEKLQRKLPLAILSNGTPDMLARAATHSGLGPLLDSILSVDAVRVFKPSPRAYQIVCDRYDVSPQDVGFVSGNSWDAHGAKSFGFNVFWLNRANRPDDPLSPHPDRVLRALADLPLAI